MTEHAWLPSSELLGYLKVAEGSENAGAAELCRKAAARLVERKRSDLKLEAVVDPATVDPDIQLGAVMLAARLYARKGTPEGIATFGELGAATILRSDPDVAQLLGLGRFAKPVAR